MPHFGALEGASTTHPLPVPPPAPAAEAWDPSAIGSGIRLPDVAHTVAIAVTAAHLAKGVTASVSGAANPRFQITVGLDANSLAGFVTPAHPTNQFPGQSAGGYGYYGFDGKKFVGGVSSAFGTAYGSGTVLDFVRRGTDLEAYLNGVLQGVLAVVAEGVVLLPAWGSGSSGGIRYGVINTGGSPFIHTIAGTTPWG